MSTMYNLLHIPLCTVMLILIFNSTAYCHAHSFTFYILFFISFFSFILSYVYFPCVVFSIFALSMERTRLSFHCWLYNLCIVVYVTNKTWNLKLETWALSSCCFHVLMQIHLLSTRGSTLTHWSGLMPVIHPFILQTSSPVGSYEGMLESVPESLTKAGKPPVHHRAMWGRSSQALL